MSLSVTTPTLPSSPDRAVEAQTAGIEGTLTRLHSNSCPPHERILEMTTPNSLQVLPDPEIRVHPEQPSGHFLADMLPDAELLSEGGDLPQHAVPHRSRDVIFIGQFAVFGTIVVLAMEGGGPLMEGFTTGILTGGRMVYNDGEAAAACVSFSTFEGAYKALWFLHGHYAKDVDGVRKLMTVNVREGDEEHAPGAIQALNAWIKEDV
uniref:Uncharacterized protein n=1 Tax=Chromera velia CCMP2878 TaxID=1169474 RepID=A0A0G4FVG2_9ALVE|eukprot:Cvel_18992.t1-p1 / transcript=Cvel_18992.t1 / gene=Cvel_18992 / organism=Chromera_velia_CCMP2878 / gene_product=hypothetical protein / transcript_product=hypothetical protein / location=Cvel_scaffold1607:14084-15866(+) / protein_length=206 / sequence_SO=supercontig / SO=protein_coding / is_pseudo=false